MARCCLVLCSILVWAPLAAAQGSLYDWTISASSTDPFVNSSAATGSLATYYLWLACCDDAQVQGMAAAEFDIVSNGPSHVATTTRNGFLNAGGTSSLLLAVGGCPCGPIVAASFLVIAQPGTMSLAPSGATGNKVTVDCEPQPTAYPIDWRGIGIGVPSQGKGEVGDCGIVGHCVGYICLPDGSCEKLLCNLPCTDGCGDVETCEDCAPTTVEPTSWGRTKSLYR